MSQEVQTKLRYQQGQLPIFQNRMYDTEAQAKACPKGDVQLVEDQRTGLVYNAAFRPELMAYDAHYQNEQATSPLFQEHLESVSRIIDRCMGRDSIVEVGYFRISDFSRMFGTVVESGHLFGGKYLYVVAELATLRKPEIYLSDRVIFPKDFTYSISEPLQTKQSQTAIWGGASKGGIFALLKARGSTNLCRHRHQSGKTGEIFSINRIIG